MNAKIDWKRSGPGHWLGFVEGFGTQVTEAFFLPRARWRALREDDGMWLLHRASVSTQGVTTWVFEIRAEKLADVQRAAQRLMSR